MEKTLEKTITKENLFNKPLKFNIRLFNNDHTTFLFVIQVLTSIYKVDTQEAYNIAKKIHEEGSAICLKNKPKSLCELILDKTIKYISINADNENNRALITCFKIEPVEEN